jgi:hypothetical protein
MKQAQVTVRSAARDPGLVEQARRRADRVLRKAFEVIGWEVSPRWADDRSVMELSRSQTGDGNQNDEAGATAASGPGE